MAELISIRDEFRVAKEDFLAAYDTSLEAWIAKHQEWASIIRNSVVSSEYVRARMGFRWQFYKVAPLESHADENAVLEAGLADEVTGLGGTLFSEVAKSAQEIWRRVYTGNTEVTHKALSPLRTLHGKLVGLSFVEPHVAPVADIIEAALAQMPAKGTITGTDLLLLQGLVCLLSDSEALVLHAQKLIEGYGPATVVDTLLAGGQTASATSSAESGGVDGMDGQDESRMDGRESDENTGSDCDAEPVLPKLPVPMNGMDIPSIGLW